MNQTKSNLKIFVKQRYFSTFAFFCAIFLARALPCIAGTVAERELLLRNILDVPREQDVFVVRLSDVLTDPHQARQVRGVEVRNENDKLLPAQFDDFSSIPNGAAEIVFEVSLPARSEQRVKLTFLDEAIQNNEMCAARLDGNCALIKTPEYTATVRMDDKEGLWVEQPKFVQTESKKLDSIMDDILAGEETPADMNEKNLMKVEVKAPLSKEGLPFCVQCAPVLGQAGAFKAWGGPVRAVAALSDAGVWATGHAKTGFGAVQVVWFPRSGKRFFLEWRAIFEDPLASGNVRFAGLRVNSAGFAWDLIMGQDGRRPYVAPVIIPLLNTRQQPYLEPYQKSTFNNKWAQAVASNAWAAVAVDAHGSFFSSVTNWDSGEKFLNVSFNYDDPGPFGNSMQPTVRAPQGLQAGSSAFLRAMAMFGGAEGELSSLKAASKIPLSQRWRQAPEIENSMQAMRAICDAFQINPVILPHPAAESAKPNWERIRALIESKSVVVATPENAQEKEVDQWARLASALGGSRHTAKSFLKYHNVFCQGKRAKDLMLVVVGEPGNNPLLDQFNDENRLFDSYPLEPQKNAVVFIDENEDQGALLMIAGNTRAATSQAIEQALAQLGDPPRRDKVIISSYPWAGRLPYAWFGLKPCADPFKAVAYRNGHAEFLMLMRAGEKLEDVEFLAPKKADARFVVFRFVNRATGNAFVAPFHDAAVSALPSTLPANSLCAIWISIPVAADAEPGLLCNTAKLMWKGGSRDLKLETEILPLQLLEKQALGFFPMGFNADSIRMYFGWDEETYLSRLTGLLRAVAPFGNTSFSLDVNGLKIETNDEGAFTINSTAFARELEAVRSAGCVEMLNVGSFNGLLNSPGINKLVQVRKLADNFEAWELVIPELRKIFAQLGVEGKLICHHSDEIGDYEAWIAYADLYKRCGVLMTVAINGYGVFNKQLGVGTMGFWIPLYNFYLNRWGKPIAEDDFECFSRKFRDERHANGEPIWPYVCGPGPYAWSPRPRSQARFLMLDTYMKGADGLSYYGGMVWSHALDPAFRKTDVADLFDTDATFTTLFYPDKDTGELLPSLRAGAFRLGLEDAGAIKALRARADKAGSAAELERKIEEAYESINMDVEDSGFDAFRRILGRLWVEQGH